MRTYIFKFLLELNLIIMVLKKNNKKQYPALKFKLTIRFRIKTYFTYRILMEYIRLSNRLSLGS